MSVLESIGYKNIELKTYGAIIAPTLGIVLGTFLVFTLL